ncbi:class I SAM-dependent methyltransferase [Flavobacterium luteolum]|uniref:class I SAM-dependent methyltransferase n=1 Tax=Flavobacterium luteolum TaxID=3003259 RepID=UPI00248EEE80|nr:class I SAM-dependent methyltransferase [Flavobacterium luteolum]
MTKKKSTGERLEFYQFSNVTVEHLHRYAIAEEFVTNKVVLDIASGEGYGSHILSKKALEVFGVDIDVESVNEASKKYRKNNLKFIVGSADKIPIESNSIDVVVSFETIEHHDKHHEMLQEIKRVLKKDGILLMSSPDKKYYSDLTGQNNPFHVKELYFHEFKVLIDSYFNFTNYFFQNSFNLNSYIWKSDLFSSNKVYSGSELNIVSELNFPVYNIVIGSDIDYPEMQNSFFNGCEINGRIYDDFIKKVKSSNTFKVGKVIVYPLFVTKKIIKRLFL